MRIGLVLMTVGLAMAASACGDRRERNTTTPNDVAARREASAPTASDQPDNPADRELIAAIRSEIMHDESLSTAARNVTIVSRSGQVTLRGNVASPDEKSRVEAAARQTAGVREVDNQIEVAP